MDLGGSRRRSSSGPKAGFVWESRMKSDEVKGGIKVFNGATDSVDQNPPPINGTDVKVELEQRAAKQSPAGKKKTWKSEDLEGGPVKIAGSRSEVCKNLDERCKELSGCYKKTRSESRKVSSESGGESGESRSDEDCGEVEVCEEKAITENVVGPIKNPAPSDSGELDEEIKVGNENGDVKEIRVEDDERKKIVIKQKNEKSNPISPLVKKLQQPPPVNHATLHSTTPKINPIADNFPGIQRTNSKLQSLVDLVMWRDVAKSAFIFGIGTFGIISWCTPSLWPTAPALGIGGGGKSQDVPQVTYREGSLLNLCLQGAKSMPKAGFEPPPFSNQAQLEGLSTLPSTT